MRAREGGPAGEGEGGERNGGRGREPQRARDGRGGRERYEALNV